MLPQIYFTNPQVVVTNEVPGYYLQSKIVQKIDNKLIRSTKLKRTMKELILEAGLLWYVSTLLVDTAYGYDPRFKVNYFCTRSLAKKYRLVEHYFNLMKDWRQT